jgi:hypothetical protein
MEDQALADKPTGVTVYPNTGPGDGGGYSVGINYPNATNWEVSSAGRLRLEADDTGISLWAEGAWHHLDDHGTPHTSP